MKKHPTILLIAVLFLAITLMAGCGGGGSSGGSIGGGGGGGGVAPAPVPTSTTPVSSTGVLGNSGYVYSTPTSGASGSKGSRQLIILATNDNIPAGFLPAPGVVVRLTGNPPLIQITDSTGHFDFTEGGNVTISSAGNPGTADVIIDDPSSPVPPICYPMLPGPLPASELTDLKIIPPFSEDTASGTVTMIAGQVEGFYVIGRQGTEWHPVSDDIAWSVSDSSMGTFMKDFGVFVSNGSIAQTTTGKVTAKVGSTLLSRDLTVIAREDLSSLSGTIKDKMATR